MEHFNTQTIQGFAHSNQKSTTQNAIKQFNQDSKGLNEFIGVLQLGNVALSKIERELARLDSLQTKESDPAYIHAKSTVFIQVQNIINASAFLGMPIFETNFSSKINGELHEICFENPLKAKDIASMNAYIKDKKQESNELLSLLSNALLSGGDDARFEQVSSADLSRLFKS